MRFREGWKALGGEVVNEVDEEGFLRRIKSREAPSATPSFVIRARILVVSSPGVVCTEDLGSLLLLRLSSDESEDDRQWSWRRLSVSLRKVSKLRCSSKNS